jgi:hypothetical protein
MIKNSSNILGVVVHAIIPTTLEVEIGITWSEAGPEPKYETLSEK